MTQTGVEIDPNTEAEDLQTEAAIASAITSVFANPIDMKALTYARAKQIMDSTIRARLSQYSTGVLSDFLTDWRVAGHAVTDRDYELVQAAAKKAVDKVIADRAKDLVEIGKVATRKPTKDSVAEKGLHDVQAEIYNRMVTGLEGMSRMATTQAREEAKYAFATKAGALGKVWRTRRDSKVRTAHGDLEGHFEHLGDGFPTIEGDSLQYPGDPKAPLRSTAGCRCRLSYRMPLDTK